MIEYKTDNEQIQQNLSKENLESLSSGIELRSEELQEVLGAVPPWILRWGISTLFAIVAILLLGSWFFRYPDTISATMVLTGENPPAAIVANANGRIRELHITDNQQVEAQEFLAVLENPASTADILLLKNYLEKLIQSSDFFMDFPEQELRLGAVQAMYASFIRSLNAYRRFFELNYFPQKITATQERIAQHRQQYQNLQRQLSISEQQHRIAESMFQRDYRLREQGIISQEALELSNSSYLQSRMSLENVRASLQSMRIQIAQLQETILDLNRQYVDTKNQLELDLSTLAGQLLNEIKNWKLNFALISPISGTITFVGFFSENQNVTAGTTVFSVVPEQETEMIGRALLPIARSGRVERGQTVNIRFLGFPDNEFGMVRGVVDNISLVPINEHFVVEISLPNGLLTTYRKTLPFSQEMTATIDIITEDMRLLERFFMPIRRIFRESVAPSL